MSIKCVYCGEAEATTKILNPNMDDLEMWDVCQDCRDVIKAQTGLALHTHMLRVFQDKHDEFYDKAIEYAKKGIQNCESKIKEIVLRTKKPIMIATFMRQDDGSYASVSKEYKEDGTIEVEVNTNEN